MDTMTRIAAASALPRIGIMQGRLSPRPKDRLQAFPSQSWRQEFSAAHALGLDAIEWIFEVPGASDNPLVWQHGRSLIRDVQTLHGVYVDSICADYFMTRQLGGVSERERHANVRVLDLLIEWTAELGATRILLPLLEEAAPSSEAKRIQVEESIRTVLPTAEKHGVVLGLEMELPGAEYAAFVRSFDSPYLRAYYDTGNSAAQGFDIAEDVKPLLPLLEAVHVKDRMRGGTSVPLGRGDANLTGFFRTLAQADVHVPVTLQHYFETDPDYDALRALNFVRMELGRAGQAAA